MEAIKRICLTNSLTVKVFIHQTGQKTQQFRVIRIQDFHAGLVLTTQKDQSDGEQQQENRRKVENNFKQNGNKELFDPFL